MQTLHFPIRPRLTLCRVAIHSFGLGLTHKPDTMIELSTRTKASYTYVKDWMMLRECVAGCLGSLQTTSHQNVKLKLRLPEGSPAKFVKISGALQITKRATGRDAEASLGDLRFGDKRGLSSPLPQLVRVHSLLTSACYLRYSRTTGNLSRHCLAGTASARSLGNHRFRPRGLGGTLGPG